MRVAAEKDASTSSTDMYDIQKLGMPACAVLMPAIATNPANITLRKADITALLIGPAASMRLFGRARN